MRGRLEQAIGIALALVLAGGVTVSGAQQTQDKGLSVKIDPNGDYSVGLAGASAAALTSGVAAEVDGHWLHSSDYPHHAVTHEAAHGTMGDAEAWRVTWTGWAGHPDLVCDLKAYSGAPFVDVQVTVHNGTGSTVHVEAIRSVETSGNGPNLGGPAAEDRVLSDSFSEDRPAEKIRDLGNPVDGMHRGVGSQLIYNRQSHQSIFVGALTSNRFLTVLRLHVEGSGANARISGWDVDSTGTTELEIENSLEKSSAEDRVQLSLPVAAGEDLPAEALTVSVGTDYQKVLEAYGATIREMHHARVIAPPLLGWWSWTAYYFGLNSGTAITNAQWEAEHLKKYGYDVFHIDEGYQYARGEYVTPDEHVFPHGLTPVEYQVRGLGLVPGIWTAPFEVSERSWVYQKHPDWLVKNAQGKPIHAGFVVEGKDQLYVLDTTNPGAQQYLRETYKKLVQQWQLHYIKMDFMDDSAIEGYYYKPDTTAMEAQRIGLQIIRDAVGPNVWLDKDGSVMLNPVGYVDYGRISQDTGHTFEASKDAATGIAARYYMNRNFFVSDPDAFTVSTQTVPDQSWHGGRKPETLSEAQVSIVLAAVSGGMLEIGDNLPSLEHSPERLGLIENPDLIDMVRLGRAAVPMDLMSFAASDGQPSIFYLKESNRQSILVVFNWTDHATSHTIRLSDLGLKESGDLTVTDVLDRSAAEQKAGSAVHVALSPHAVKVLKFVDTSIPAETPVIEVDHPEGGATGADVKFSAHQSAGDPVLSYQWSFGDGVQVSGQRVQHAWTDPGDYQVHLTASGLDGTKAEKDFTVHVTGAIDTSFSPELNRRFEPK